MGRDNSAAMVDQEPSSEAPCTRRQLRSRRKRDVRGVTISVKRMAKRDVEIGRLLYPEDEHADIARPTTRGECIEGSRPCPFVSCKHHLYLDVSARTGAIKVNFPDIDADGLEQLPESCALDVADRQGATLEEVGAIMNLTRERIRQVEVTGLAKLLATREMREIRDLVDDGKPLDPSRKRRLPVVHVPDGNEDDDFDPETFASEALDSD